MSRSVWKPKFIDPFLLRQCYALTKLPLNKRPVLQIFSRASVILPDFVGLKVMVHSGMRFTSITINSTMVGHRFGEFSYPKRMGITIHRTGRDSAVNSKVKKKKY